MGIKPRKGSSMKLAILTAAIAAAGVLAHGAASAQGSAENNVGIERYPGYGAHPPIVYPDAPAGHAYGYPPGYRYAYPQQAYPHVAPGMHLPRDYRDRERVVRNWRRYGLAAPPAGYQWLRIGQDYALVERRSGRIAQLVR
jgi:Ni/Co efflux regulator RcnB